MAAATLTPPCEPCEPCTEPGAAAFYFSRGPGTFKVPRGLPAAARVKLVSALDAAGHKTGVVLLRGGAETCRYDSDHEPIFRQESYFAHLFAVKEPDCWAIIELPSGRSTLFIPRLAPEYAIWMGEIKKPAYFKEYYGVDAVLFVDELKATVGAAAAGATPGPILVLAGTNSDSGLDISSVLPTSEGVPEGAIVDAASLYNIAAECRVCKSAEEVEVMRYAAWVSSRAHASVMHDCRPGMMEYQLEALFLLLEPSTTFHRPSMAFHRPSTTFHRPSTAFRRPSTAFHRPSTAFHDLPRPSIGLPRPPTDLPPPSTDLPPPSKSGALPLPLRVPRRLPPPGVHVHLRVRPRRGRPPLRPCRRAQ